MTAEITEAAAKLGIAPADLVQRIIAALPVRYYGGIIYTTSEGEYTVKSRDAEARVEAWLTEQVVAEVTSQSAAGAPLATERQVAYIMSLVRDGAHLEGGFIMGQAPTAASVRRMTRAAASALIDSLTGNY